MKVRLDLVKTFHGQKPHSWTNFEVQKNNKNEDKFNFIYSRRNSSKLKDGVNVINLGVFKSKGTHWMSLYVYVNKIICFDRFGGEHIPKEIKKSIGNKNMRTNIYRIQAYDSIMCRYFCIGFIDFLVNVCKIKFCCIIKIHCLLTNTKRIK